MCFFNCCKKKSEIDFKCIYCHYSSSQIVDVEYHVKYFHPFCTEENIAIMRYNKSYKL